MKGPRRPWSGVIAVEGRATPDGRCLEPGALTWPSNQQLPLYGRGTLQIGWVTRIWREGHRIRAEGLTTGLPPTKFAADVAIGQVEVGPRDAYLADDGTWCPSVPPATLPLEALTESDDLLYVITAAELRLVRATATPAWLECVLDL